MPKIDFILDSNSNAPSTDPFARGNVDTGEREVSIDILTNELYLELPYMPVTSIRFSSATGRPIDELDEETANEMYDVIGYILPRVERKLSESKVQGAYGVDRVQLEKLKSSLMKILTQKDAYMSEKFPKHDNDDSNALRIESDMGGMKYYGQQDKVHLFYFNYREKHTFTLRVAPTKEEGVYLLTSTAMLSGANTPHFRSERYVDITRTRIEEEIGREKSALERATDHASRHFWG